MFFHCLLDVQNITTASEKEPFFSEELLSSLGLEMNLHIFLNPKQIFFVENTKGLMKNN